MLFKDIQALEHAARTAMAGNDDQHQPTQQKPLKHSHLGLALIILAAVSYFILA